MVDPSAPLPAYHPASLPATFRLECVCTPWVPFAEIGLDLVWMESDISLCEHHQLCCVQRSLVGCKSLTPCALVHACRIFVFRSIQGAHDPNAPAAPTTPTLLDIHRGGCGPSQDSEPSLALPFILTNRACCASVHWLVTAAFTVIATSTLLGIKGLDHTTYSRGRPLLRERRRCCFIYTAPASKWHPDASPHPPIPPCR